MNGRWRDGQRVPGLGRRDVYRLVDDAILHVRLCEMSNVFQERHRTFAKEGAEETRFAFGSG